MKRRHDAEKDVVLRKDAENAMDGPCKRRGGFKENENVNCYYVAGLAI